MDAFFSDSIERLFATVSTPQQVRAIEAGETATSLWRQIEDSGFADALVAEEQGGAGLGLAGAFEILLACGSHALPVPLAPTMVARAVLAQAGQSIPRGPITFASTVQEARDGSITCPRVAYARVADWVLMNRAGTCVLAATKNSVMTPTGGHGSLEGDLRWSADVQQPAGFPNTLDWEVAGACLMAAQLAGSMQSALAATVRYAGERSQFGRLIGKFQAVQQQISVMAEEVAAARTAAQMGCASPTHVPDPLFAAVAKARTSEAAVKVAAIAHAVHGAIGITEEHDLQLYTRRMHEWRRAFGSESYWNRKIGEALRQDKSATSLVFIRERLSPCPV